MSLQHIGSNPRVGDEAAVDLWAKAALPGDTLVYYTGHLAADSMYWLPTHRRHERAQAAYLLGRAARTLAEAGKVALFQKKVCADCYRYLAVRLPSPLDAIRRTEFAVAGTNPSAGRAAGASQNRSFA